MEAESLTRMRRSDRRMSDEGVRVLLARSPYGCMATAVDGQPFQHVSLFWYDDTSRRVYFHGAKEGRTLANLRANPRVCFTVAEIGRLIPATTAMGFSNEYASVVLFGRARVVEAAGEKHLALQALLDKYFPDLRPGRDYRPITDEEMATTAVVAIEIESWSGKQKKVTV